MQQNFFPRFEHSVHSLAEASCPLSESSDDEELVVFLEKGHQEYKECSSQASNKRREAKSNLKVSYQSLCKLSNRKWKLNHWHRADLSVNKECVLTFYMITSRQLTSQALRNTVSVRFWTGTVRWLSISLISQSLTLHSTHPRTFLSRSHSLHMFCLEMSSEKLSR